VGLLDGKRPLVEHEWGLARGLDLEPEQLVAVVRGRSILCGESLSDQLAQAPRSTQIEAIESVMRAWKVEYYG
jgi:hypothetical protein